MGNIYVKPLDLFSAKNKNIDYYKGNRFFKITRGFYPHIYTDGYVYGRYYNPEYYNDLGWDFKNGKWINI